MSDPRTKTERSRAKDARQTPALDIIPPRPRSKKAKPFVIEYKWKGFFNSKWNRGWLKFGAYRTKEIAEKAMKDARRKYSNSFEFRKRPKR